MDFKILYTEPALADLEAVMYWSWKTQADTAERFGRGLLDHLGLLSTFPFVGARLYRNQEVRKLLHSPIRVYYSVDEKRKVVTILRFSHVAQQQPKF